MTEETRMTKTEEPRRAFVTKVAAVAVGAIVACVPIMAGVVTLLDPLIRRRHSRHSDGEVGTFVRVTSASSLDSTGAPRLFPVLADLQDAWNKFPRTEIGSVYLWRTSDGKLEAFTARCPHLGCTVNYKANEERFGCPCHDSSFNLDGSPNNGIPPRGMDPLEVKEVEGEILVSFQKFRAGIHERVPV